MDTGAAFKPAGPGMALFGSFAVTPSATLLGLQGDWASLVYNRSSSQDAYLAYGPNSSVVTSATAPIASGAPATQNLLPLPHGTVQTFTFSGPTYFSVIVLTGNAIVDIVPGSTGSV